MKILMEKDGQLTTRRVACMSEVTDGGEPLIRLSPEQARAIIERLYWFLSPEDRPYPGEHQYK